MSRNSDRWYVRDAGNVTGPFPRADLQDRCRRGELDWYHEVSQDRMIWVSALMLEDPGSDDNGFGMGDKSAATTKLTRRKMPVVMLGLTGVFGLGGVLYAIGSASAKAEKGEAILRVLKEDQAVSASTLKSISKREKPSIYSQAIVSYVVNAREIDTEPCPPEFRIAFKRHLEAWVDLAVAVKAQPETEVEGFFIGFWNGYFYNEKDGGMRRMAQNIQQASLGIKETFREVEAIALDYGVALP